MDLSIPSDIVFKTNTVLYTVCGLGNILFVLMFVARLVSCNPKLKKKYFKTYFVV
jgi:hypothetical protein